MNKLCKFLLSNILLVSSIFAVSCGETASTPITPSTSTSVDFNDELLEEHFATLGAWNLENGTFTRESYYSTFSINDTSKKMVLSIRHLSTRKDRNYKLSLTAKGDATLNIKLLNNNSLDIIKGINTSKKLSGEFEEYDIVFVSNDNYENLYLIIETDSSFSIDNLKFGRTNIYNDYEAPVFSNVDDKCLYITSSFDYTKNVTVKDNVDGDLTFKYQVELPQSEDVVVNGNNVSFKKIGDYKFKYTCIDSEDNLSTVERVVSVVDSMPSGYEFIKNGKFDQGLNYWHNDQYDGARANFSIIKEGDNNVLEADVLAIPDPGSYQPFPRLVYGKLGSSVETDEIVIEKGASYTVSFRIKCSTTRTIQFLVGEVLDKADENGKWTHYFAQEPSTGGWGIRARTITPEWQVITYDFTMALNETNTRGCLAFTFGDVGDNPQVGTIHLDDVSLVKK